MCIQSGFLSNLVKVFPGLAKRPLLLTGESYAGTYIVCPALADLQLANYLFPLAIYYKDVVIKGEPTSKPLKDRNGQRSDGFYHRS